MQEYIKKAIKNWSLSLWKKDRNWKKYFLVFSKLVWARNFRDGYEISVYDKADKNFLDTVVIDSNEMKSASCFTK